MDVKDGAITKAYQIDVCDNSQADVSQSVIVTSLEFIYNWGRSNSLWPLAYATACCGIEMISSSCPQHDIARFGSEVFRASPRQADLMILAGTITKKMMPQVVTLWEQIAEPKYAIAMGNCVITGGIFKYSPSVVHNVPDYIPIDVFIPGCAPRPEALFHGIITLQHQIRRQKMLKRKDYVGKQAKRLKDGSLNPNYVEGKHYPIILGGE